MAMSKMEFERISVIDIATVFLEDEQYLREWQFLYSHLRLKLKLGGSDLSKIFSRNEECLLLTEKILQHWVSENGAKSTIQALLDVLENGSFYTLKAKLYDHFKLDDDDNQAFSNEGNKTSDFQRQKSGGVRILELFHPHPDSSGEGKSRILIYASYLLNLLALVGDLPVAIVSINGEQNLGKSFLANQMVKFLKYSQTHPTTWLDIPMDKCFLWKHDVCKVTNGLQLWHEPIIVSSQNGEKIAVILLDTQGLYDRKTEKKGDSVIFGLSLFLSSIFIFNTKDMKEENYENLHYFLEFTKFALDKNVNVFQKLVYLVRDWRPTPKHSCGYYDATSSPSTSKNNLWQYIFQPEESEVTPAGKLARDRTLKLFQDTCVYAMRRPLHFPDEVNSSGEWDVEFRNSVIHFLTHFLSPESLFQSLKTIFGKVVTGNELRGYVSSWVQQISHSGGMPEAKTMMEEMAHKSCTARVTEFLKEYEHIMEAILEENETGLEMREFDDIHSNVVSSLEEKFLQVKVFGGKQMLEGYRAELLTKIENSLKLISKINLANWSREEERRATKDLEERRNVKVEQSVEEYKKRLEAYLKFVESNDLEDFHLEQESKLVKEFIQIELSSGEEFPERHVSLLKEKIAMERLTFERSIERDQLRQEIVTSAEKNLNGAVDKLKEVRKKLKEVDDNKLGPLFTKSQMELRSRENRVGGINFTPIKWQEEVKVFDERLYLQARHAANEEVNEWQERVENFEEELNQKLEEWKQ